MACRSWPGWTRRRIGRGKGPRCRGVRPTTLTLYGDFVYHFVEHYRGRVRYIQIWNEPNLYIEWGNRPVDPAGYVELLRIAYQRAKEADPNVYVLSAPLAITLGRATPRAGQVARDERSAVPGRDVPGRRRALL